jgi:threonine/homoserine/homoserine lactone efflux protein
MSDAVVFLFGCVVTALCIAGVAVLLWGGTQTDSAKPDAGTRVGNGE